MCSVLNELDVSTPLWRTPQRPLATILSLPQRTVMHAVEGAIAYADMFDFPLTRSEIHRFLPARTATPYETDQAIDALLRSGTLSQENQYIFLAGRRRTSTRRRARLPYVNWTWRRAQWYARLVWLIPSVRMVAVTGSLAANNVAWNDDIDLFIITQAGRLWITRGMIVLLCRLATLRGDTICPNYLVTTDALRLDGHDMYAAHEFAQMVPLHGKPMAQQFSQENTWVQDFLPNAAWPPVDTIVDRLPFPLRVLKASARILMSTTLFDRLELWEQHRKILRLSRNVPSNVQETLYTADVCKGHDRGHRARIMNRWTSRRVTTSRV
jgi:hypothetical protein